VGEALYVGRGIDVDVDECGEQAIIVEGVRVTRNKESITQNNPSNIKHKQNNAKNQS
jgi:hypothetical protein